MRNKFRLIFKLGFVVIFVCMFTHLNRDVQQLWTYLHTNRIASPLGDTVRIPLVLPYVALAAGLRQIYKLLYINAVHKGFRVIWISKAAAWLTGFVYCLYWNYRYLDTLDYVQDMVLREAFNFFPFLCACYLAEFLLRVSVNQKLSPLNKSTPFPQILRWVSRLIHFQWNPKYEVVHYGFCLIKCIFWGDVILLLLNELRFSLFLGPWGETDTVWGVACIYGHTLLISKLVPLTILCLMEWLFFDGSVYAAENKI